MPVSGLLITNQFRVVSLRMLFCLFHTLMNWKKVTYGGVGNDDDDDASRAKKHSIIRVVVLFFVIFEVFAYFQRSILELGTISTPPFIGHKV